VQRSLEQLRQAFVQLTHASEHRNLEAREPLRYGKHLACIRDRQPAALPTPEHSHGRVVCKDLKSKVPLVAPTAGLKARVFII
jgi:hypothetical protein